MRGSCPCPCEGNRRYGGNTACVLVEADDPEAESIILDLGTGLRELGLDYHRTQPFAGVALVTHLHWDHVQGLPFFAPILAPGAELDVYGPRQDARNGKSTLEEAFSVFMSPPHFPVRPDELLGQVRFHDVEREDFSIGSAKVKVRPVPHCGSTVGFRIEMDGVSLAYVSDHQGPVDPRDHDYIDEGVLELCDGADLLIHDAQYRSDEFALKSDWGHCTVDYALKVADRAGVRHLALFHHDPAHSDDELDRLQAECQAAAAGTAVDRVTAAAEGLTLRLG
ncbi:MAG: MBL fold metallo-hydrolase [Acidimicrobiales bacterium]